jgi:hypothetical protein
MPTVIVATTTPLFEESDHRVVYDRFFDLVAVNRVAPTSRYAAIGGSNAERDTTIAHPATPTIDVGARQTDPVRLRSRKSCEDVGSTILARPCLRIEDGVENASSIHRRTQAVADLRGVTDQKSGKRLTVGEIMDAVRVKRPPNSPSSAFPIAAGRTCCTLPISFLLRTQRSAKYEGLPPPEQRKGAPSAVLLTGAPERPARRGRRRSQCIDSAKG